MFKLLGSFFSLSRSNLPLLDFELSKSTFLASFYKSTPIAFFKYAFVALLDKSNSTFTLYPKHFGCGKYSLIYILSFLSVELLKKLSQPFHLTYS